MAYELRDYQQCCHDAILRAWGIEPWASMDMKKAHAVVLEAVGRVPWYDGDEHFASQIAALGTSAGKTIIAAKLIQTLLRLGFRVMMCADTNELCQQPLDKMYAATGIIAGLEKADSKAPRSAAVCVASVQTLQVKGRLEAFQARWGTPDFIIHDEAHAGADRAAQINAAFPKVKTLGLTATPFKSGLADLSKWYECVGFTMNALDLMKEGYVTPVEVVSVPINIDISQVNQSRTKDGSDYKASELATTIEPYYREVIAAMKQHAPNRKFIIFHPLVSSSKAFTDLCNQEGISAAHCDGTSDDRSGTLKAFEAGHFQWLNNADVFSKGVDFIRADALLNLSPTRSVSRFRQRGGRIMRCIPGTIDGLKTAAERRAAIAASEKPNAIIFDVLWQAKKFGLAGPASIIADNQEQADAMDKKIRMARTPEDMQEIRKAVQAEREAELIAAQAEANRLRGASFSAESLGALLHDESLCDYEPVMAWEKRPMSEKQETALRKRGIDTATIKGMGHAGKVLDAIFGRDGLAPFEALLPLRERGIEHPETMSLDDAIRVLRDSFPIGFGKHIGCPFKDIPQSYWDYTRKNHSIMRWIKDTQPACARYMAFLERQKAPVLPLT